MNKIYFGGGCFWGVEHYFKQVNGVTQTMTGYANGLKDNPTYQEVCSQIYDFVEVVEVEYDENIVSLQMLCELFLIIIDPFSIDKQGNDIGRQYRTGIYYVNSQDEDIIKRVMAYQQLFYQQKMVVEILPLKNFYNAENYHQDYLTTNPKGYCHIDSRYFEFAKHINQDYKDHNNLTPLQYEVIKNQATEPAFNNAYYNNKDTGVYVDVETGEPLFISDDKFDSGCGWPAFSRPILNSKISYIQDESHGMQRIEVVNNHNENHLGHVFNDGLKDAGGLRYCINSASLKFIPFQQLDSSGYGYLKILFKGIAK